MTSSEPVLLPALDRPPTRWVDSHDILADLSPEEIEEGQRLGRTIDIEDDDDAGSWHMTHPKPKMLVRRLGMTNSLTVAQNIKTALLDHGAGRVVSPFTGKVGGVSIELQAGRGTGGFWAARLHHHTASAPISKTLWTPALKTVKNGRSDLQGPLANGYGGGDFVYRLITLEWANHPGLGGPMAFSKGTVPKDNGRPYLWGTEWDWDGVSRWPDEYLEWMACCDAGLADVFGLAIEDQAEHKNWAPLRKIDRNDITRTTSIARTRAVYNAPAEDDMGNTELEIKTWVNQCIENKLGLKAGENMSLAVFGATSNKDVFNRQTATNNPASVASMVLSLVSAVTDLTTLVASMKTDLSDDEASIVANSNARAAEILAAIEAEPATDPAPTA